METGFHLEEKIKGEDSGVRAKFINIHDVNYLSHARGKMERFVVRRPHTAVEERAPRTTNRAFLYQKNMGTRNFQGEASSFPLPPL